MEREIEIGACALRIVDQPVIRSIGRRLLTADENIFGDFRRFSGTNVCVDTRYMSLSTPRSVAGGR